MLQLSGIRQTVFVDRYSLKDVTGKPIEKTPDEMWRRVARGIAAVEGDKKRPKIWEKRFYEALSDFKFVPGGRILSGAGTGYNVTFYNCFVIPSPKDSREGILETLKQMVEIMARGGGVGINLSSLRPRGARVTKVNGFSSGPCNWAELFSVATKDIIQQGGCFAGNELVMTHLGLTPIREMVISNKNWYVATHDDYQKITAKFNNGVKPLFEVRTEAGYTVKTTAEHKFLTVNNHGHFYLKKLGEFSIGDTVVMLLGQWRDDIPFMPLRTDIPAPSKYSYGRMKINLPKELSEKLAFLIGVYDADGSKIRDEFSPNGKGLRIAVAGNRQRDLNTLLRVIRVIKEVFGITPTVTKGDGAVHNVNIFSREVNEFLALNGLLKNSSLDVSVPQSIFSSPRSVVEAYIAGVFLGDGTNRGGKGGLRITTVSEIFASQIQLLLLNLGIAATIKKQVRQQQNWRTTYTVTVNGQRFMKRFAEVLAQYNEKVLDHPISRRDGAFNWPFNLTEKFAYLSGFQRTIAHTNPTTSHKAVAFLEQRIADVSERERRDIGFLANCVPDKIAAINYSGEENVYDLEVEDVHLLSGNGFYTSNSRRGALMLMLWDWHPDIEEFITVKKDLTRINGANLSVCASDSFMEAVKKDADWNLVFPDVKDPEYDALWDGDIQKWRSLGKKVIVQKTVKARAIWDLICEAAWASAEPGLVFMERYNKVSNTWYYERINCVNPCVTGDTLVATEDGWREAKSLIVGQKILTPCGFRPITKIFNNGVQRIYKVTFSDGGYLEATSDHKLRVNQTNGESVWITVNSLKPGDRVVKLASPLGVLLGSVNHGRQSNKSNSNKHKKDNNHHQILSVEVSDIHTSPYSFALLAKNKLNNQQILLSSSQNIIADQSSVVPVTKGGITPSANTTWPISAVISESFVSSERVSSGFVNTPASVLPTESIIKQKQRPSALDAQWDEVRVINVEDTGRKEEVFDVLEPTTLTWITNGYVSLDCGEQGLPDWGVCNLGALNLSAFVNKKGEMDYELLFETAKTAERFLDDVVDATVYFFDEIAKAQKDTRRTGLGTMGLGDALIKMKVRYGSEKSLRIIEKIFRTIRDAAYEASIEAAKEKGSFGHFEAKKYLRGKFIKELPQKIREGINKYGIRNAVLLTQAPTGSTSLMSGVSSGIEPVYEFSFIRRDRLGEHVLYHPLFEVWKKNNPNDPIPDYFVSANDLTPEDHVRVQAVIQKYTDSSISKTVNAPSTHTIEDVKKLYTLAYELGCKGITYMRDGSRLGVLSRITDKKLEAKANGEVATRAPNGETAAVPMLVKKAPRPAVVHGATYQVQTPVGIAYVTINTVEDQEPLEMFINIGKAGSDVAAMAEALGRIISLNLRMASPLSGKERMKLVFNELVGIGGSRHLGFGENRVRSLPDALAKAIAKHFSFRVKNGDDAGNGQTKQPVSSALTPPPIQSAGAVPLVAQNALPYPREMDLCPSCGEASLAFEEGCKKCYGCGFSEC